MNNLFIGFLIGLVFGVGITLRVTLPKEKLDKIKNIIARFIK